MSSGWIDTTIQTFVDAGDVEIKTGPFGTQLHASDYVEHGTPVINVRNIGFGNIRPEKLEYISDETVQRLSSHLLRPNDIVFGPKGAVERHAFIRNQQDRWFQGSDCIRLRINSPCIDPRFLSYSFLTHSHQEWMMAQCSHGATMASLNQDIIKRIPLHLPPLPAQRKIASILSAYDDLIENNTRRIAILEEMAQALYREWFVHFRYPGHEHVPLVDSGIELGAVPEGWEVKQLGQMCTLVMGQSPKSEFYNTEGEGLPFHQGVTDFGHRFPTDRVYCTVENRIAEAGDILFSVRAPVGRINLASKRIVIGRGLSAIRSNSGNQVFLFHQLQDRFQEEDIIGNGAIFKAVTKSDMHDLFVIAPSPDLVAQFECYVESAFQQVSVLTTKNINLRNARDLLLPKLISGEVDVVGTT